MEESDKIVIVILAIFGFILLVWLLLWSILKDIRKQEIQVKDVKFYKVEVKHDTGEIKTHWIRPKISYNTKGSMAYFIYEDANLDNTFCMPIMIYDPDSNTAEIGSVLHFHRIVKWHKDEYVIGH